MKLKRLINLFIGILFYGLGIVIAVRANIGIAPWDAFHQGLSNLLGITFGQASIGVGLFILFINYFLNIRIGLGTLLNILGIGIVIDFLFKINLIPVMHSFPLGLLSIVIAMFTIAFATYFYINAGFGTGPRDGLMVGLVNKTHLKVGIIRGMIELSVLTIGYLLGAKIGIGTLILGLGIGPVIQWTFKRFNFDVGCVQHDYLFEKNKA